MTRAELMTKLESSGLPFAPIAKPEDLFDDPHLAASGGLLDISLPDGNETRLPALPLELNEKRPGVRRDPPASGQHTIEVLKEAGFSDDEVSRLIAGGVASAA